MTDSTPIFTLGKSYDAQVDGASSSSAYHDFTEGSAVINVVAQTPSQQTQNQVDCNILMPGLGVYMSRRVLVQGSIYVKCIVSAPAAATSYYTVPNIRLGELATCAYPFNHCVSSATVQANSVSITVQQGQYLDAMIRTLDQAYASDVCPTNVDDVADLNHAVGTQHNQVTADWDSRNQFRNNGSYRNIFLCKADGTAPTAGVYESGTMTAFQDTLTGEWCLRANSTATAITDQPVYYRVAINEPLLMPPFRPDADHCGLVNLAQVQIRLALGNMASSASRIFRTTSVAGPTSIQSACVASAAQAAQCVRGAPANCQLVQISAFKQDSLVIAPKLKFYTTFMSPTEGMPTPTRSVYPFAYWNPFRTTNSSAVAAKSADTTQTTTLTTLPYAPDYMAVWVQGDVTTDNTFGSNYTANTTPLTAFTVPTINAVTNKILSDRANIMLTIKRLNITWNVTPGIMQTVPPEDLYLLSNRNGVSQPWLVSALQNLPEGGTDTTTLPATVGNFYAQWTPSAGSGTLVLARINKDLPTAPGTAGGVSGNYTFQATVTYVNQTLDVFAANNVSVVCCPISSQYLVLRAGGSAEVIPSVANEATEYETEVSSDRSVQALDNINSISGGTGPAFNSAGARANDPLAASRRDGLLMASMPNSGGSSSAIPIDLASSGKRQRT
jgi:hypothetical protein